MKKYIVVFTIYFFSNISLADGISTGKIKGYVLSDYGGDNVGLFITPESAITTTPTCNSTGRFSISTNTAFGKFAVSSILAAYHADKILRLVGNGTCSPGVYSNSEALRKICTEEGPC